MRTSNYNFDIDKHSLIKPVVIIRSGDHDIDTIKITLSNQGEPVDLTNAKVKFMGTTPAGNKIIDDVNIKIVDATSGIFEYTFPSAAGSSVGEYQDAYFSIILGNGQTSTMNFRIQVLSGVDISAPAASDYVSQYNTMVSNLNSAYDSATHETNEKMASTVSSLATSAATVLDSALARVNDVNSTANSASSAASNAVSMAASVASDITSQASYINSVASSAVSNVSSVAAGVVDKLNNISVGGRNYLLNSRSLNISTFNNSATFEKIPYDANTNMWHLTSPSGSGAKVGFIFKQSGNTSKSIQTGERWIFSFDIKGTGVYAEPLVGIEGPGKLSYPTGNVPSSWARVSATGVSNGNDYVTIYFNTTSSALDVYIKLPELELGNVPSDWTPAPEDAPSNDAQLMHKTGNETAAGDKTFTGRSTFALSINGSLNTREAAFTDFATVANDMFAYAGNWFTKPSVPVANSPYQNAWGVVEVIPGDAKGSGRIIFTPYDPGDGNIYYNSVSWKGLGTWLKVANDSNVLHNTGNETAAGDKTFTGNTTLANIKSSNVKTGSVKLGGLTINFRETAVGVNVYMDGSWQGSFSMGDAYVDSGSIPTSISNPRQNVVLNIVGNAGVGGVTTNSPFKLEVLITTDGKVRYRSKNLRDNDTAARTATIVGAASTFYALD